MAGRSDPQSYKTQEEVRIAVKKKYITRAQGNTRVQELFTQGKRSPLGVPEGYYVDRPVPITDKDYAAVIGGTSPETAYGLDRESMFSTKRAKPLYYKGDENGYGAIRNFPTDEDGIIALQEMLVKIGYLKEGAYVPSVWGPTSSEAFKNILVNANRTGHGWFNQLNAELTAVDKHGALEKAAERKRDPLSVRLTNPDDIRKTVEEVGRSLHGTYLSDDEVARLTSSYQQTEQAFQTARYEASGFNPITGQTDTSGMPVDTAQPGINTYTEPAKVDTLAEKAIREQHPTEFKANTFTDRMNEIVAAMRSPVQGNTSQVGPIG